MTFIKLRPYFLVLLQFRILFSSFLYFPWGNSYFFLYCRVILEYEYFPLENLKYFGHTGSSYLLYLVNVAPCKLTFSNFRIGFSIEKYTNIQSILFTIIWHGRLKIINNLTVHHISYLNFLPLNSKNCSIALKFYKMMLKCLWFSIFE